MRALGLIAWMVVSGCNAHVFSPPTGSFPIESSATVGQGKHGVRGDLAGSGAMFGPKLVSARGNYRYGITDKMEVSAAPSLIAVREAKPSDSHPNIYALRLGAKYAPIRHVGVIGGMGGGGSAGGAFLSPDLGVIGAYENRYVVPFVAARALLSVPIQPRTVHFTIGDGAADGPDDEDGEPDVYRLRPKLTLGHQLSLGLRVPLTHDEQRQTKPSLACAAGLTSLRDFTKNGQETYSGLSCAIDVVF